MKILIACEFSGIVREAFAIRGHDAWSCDLLPTEKPGSGKHIIGDVRKINHELCQWDLILAFPPCTYLASSGARWWKDRKEEQKEAIKFCKWIMSLPSPGIAMENPIGKLSTAYRKPDQIIQPWQFGHGETKSTCLWLKGLPLLKPTCIVGGRVPRVHHEKPSPDRWKNRSRTYQGIAEAMATQWSEQWNE